MTAFSSEELTGLAALGAIGSVCAVLLRSTQRNLDSLQQMREDANTVIAQHVAIVDVGEICRHLQCPSSFCCLGFRIWYRGYSSLEALNLLS
jgi:hypothetical protein